ncbi:uncharacterized protein LOC106024738 isoform X2 [Esox lucius]|nr:uncharacterized protein LOC106024738 isoform X2 [Esox lucius]
MLMYALSLSTEAPFWFIERDMARIRKWWCISLMERFQIDGHGQRFAYWTNEARALLQGSLQPIYRVPKVSKREHEVSLHGAGFLSPKENNSTPCTPWTPVVNVECFSKTAHLDMLEQDKGVYLKQFTQNTHIQVTAITFAAKCNSENGHVYYLLADNPEPAGCFSSCRPPKLGI